MTYDIRAFSCKNSFGYSVTIFILMFMFVVMLVSQLSVYFIHSFLLLCFCSFTGMLFANHLMTPEATHTLC